MLFCSVGEVKVRRGMELPWHVFLPMTSDHENEIPVYQIERVVNSYSAGSMPYMKLQTGTLKIVRNVAANKVSTPGFSHSHCDDPHDYDSKKLISFFLG